MSLSRRFAIAAIALTALGLANAANAASLTYAEISQSGTRRTITYAPLGISNTNVPTPYGTHSINAIPGGWAITFNPTAGFFANASSPGGASSVMDGKIDFTLTFDTPVFLQATITEGGTWSTSGNAFVSMFGGGVVSENDHIVPQEIVGTGMMLGTFNPNGTWMASTTVAPFQNAYASYDFSIDNMLFAESLAGQVLGSANITKNNFTITITTIGGGQPPEPAPLPAAAFGGLGLGAIAFAFRKKLAK